MSFHSIPPFEAPQDVNVDTIRREVGDAIGPFMEPFYIVPQSTLLGLLRARAATAPQPTPQHPIYTPNAFALQQHTGQSSLVAHGYYAPMASNASSSEYHAMSVNTNPSLNAPTAYYGHPQTPVSDADQIHATQTPPSWNHVPSPALSAVTSSHATIPLPYPHATVPLPLSNNAASILNTSQARSQGDEVRYSLPLKAPAYANCYVSRKKCGWQRPCQRCVDTRLQCVERERTTRRVRFAAPMGVDLAAQASTLEPPSAALDWVAGPGTSDVFAGAGITPDEATSFGLLLSSGERAWTHDAQA